MTRSTTKKLTEPLSEPEREFRRRRRAAWRQQQNESLEIARRNLFDDEASSSTYTGAKTSTPLKTLGEHSLPNLVGLKSENPVHHMRHYLSIVDNIQADGAIKDPSTLRFFHFSLKGKAKECRREEEGEEGHKWVVRSKFEDELSGFMLKNSFLTKGLGEMFDQHRHDPHAKGAKVLEDLLSHKEKLEKAASSVKLVDFVVFEIDEDEAVPIILGRPFLATDRAVIDVHEGKLSLRVGNETITFNIGKFMRSRYSRDDYLYCADHTTKLVREQWVDTNDHDGKWIKAEEQQDPNEVRALELKELPEHREYAFLQGDDQLPVVISSALSASKKIKLLKVLRNHKGAITWSIADIKGINSSFCTHKILIEDEFKPTV
nr:hypothetical protein [Tanacetum cinerariifolium]